MSNIIHLLPDNIANQIAAGEVIQRPASAVKELLENAVDAGATEIKLLITDAGKALIQVIDNGKGMSETDARMCFERHATSKIKNINDLFHIKTMGFRGEALASIAAVAQVELKTRTASNTIGTFIEIENSKVTRQEPIAWNPGTSIAMKNLFFNVPARRNFLKSNQVEMRHITEEFIRVSMAYPKIFFSLSSNGQEVMHLEAGNLKQRIVQILGNNYASKLVSIQEQTDYMNIYGFVGKPETAKKTRGDQYFFVNNRFIKSGYLNHALQNAFDGMIAKDSFPMYALFIDLDPSQIDINVHPTKQEIKFEDEKIIYAFVQSAVKHALAQFSITPALDFELDPNIQQLDAVSKPFTESQQQQARDSSLFQTFRHKNQAHFVEKTSDLKDWKTFFTPAKELSVESNKIDFHQGNNPTFSEEKKDVFEFSQQPIQINRTYIVLPTNAGFLLIHQQNAHERILYERYEKALSGKQIPSQQLLFPTTLSLSIQDAQLLQELMPDLQKLGFILENTGNHHYSIQGIPADVPQGNEKAALENILEHFKHFNTDLKYTSREKLFRSMAFQQAIKPGMTLSEKECIALAEDLMACNTPNVSPAGKPTFLEYSQNELSRIFGR